MSKRIAKQFKGNFKSTEGLYVGTYESFDIIIRYDGASQLYNMFFSIKSLDELKDLNKKLQKYDKHCVAKYINNSLTITHACDSRRYLVKQVNEVLEIVVRFLKENKIKNVCRCCKKVKETNLVDFDSNLSFYCEDCFDKTSNEHKKQIEQYKKIKENPFTGIIGAIIGSIPGVILFLILAYLRINSSLAALIIMLGAAYGYKWFAGILKETGLIISLIVGLICILITNEFASAYDLYLEYNNLYNISLFEAYKAIPYYLEHSEVYRQIYYQNLMIAVIFGALGSLSNFGLYRRYIAINKIKKVRL